MEKGKEVCFEKRAVVSCNERCKGRDGNTLRDGYNTTPVSKAHADAVTLASDKPTTALACNTTSGRPSQWPLPVDWRARVPTAGQQESTRRSAWPGSAVGPMLGQRRRRSLGASRRPLLRKQGPAWDGVGRAHVGRATSRAVMAITAQPCKGAVVCWMFVVYGSHDQHASLLSPILTPAARPVPRGARPATTLPTAD